MTLAVGPEDGRQWWCGCGRGWNGWMDKISSNKEKENDENEERIRKRKIKIIMKIIINI